MQSNLNVRSPWSQLSIFLGLLAAGLFVTTIVGGILLVSKVGVSGIGKEMDLGDPRLTGTLKGIQALSTIFLFGIPAFGYALITFRSHKMEQLGFRPVDRNLFYVLSVILVVASVPFEGWLGELNKGINLPHWMIEKEADANRQIAVFLKADSFLAVLNNIFIVAVLPAVFEEVCFRGALQRIMIQLCKNAWVGILITAILFSAFHLQFQGFLPRVLLGTILGAAYWYSGSLWVPILMHFVINGVQVVLAGYYPQFIKDDPSVPVYVALISLAIVVVLIYIMRRQSTVRYADVYDVGKPDEFDGFPS